MGTYKRRFMSCNSTASDDDEATPPPKRAKRSRCGSACRQRGTRTRNLCDLPSEVLLKILDYINIWHHNRLRGTSRRLRAIHDTYVMHEFTKGLHKRMERDPCSYESATLTVIRLATEVYVRSGFESTFCNCMVPMLRSNYKWDPFCPRKEQLIKFLKRFYDSVDEQMVETCPQKSRLLFNVTLMRLFKRFDKATVISSTAMPVHWRIVIELQGPWIGRLSAPAERLRDHPKQRSNLIIILAEILLATITDTSFSRVSKCVGDIYIFGNDSSNHARAPKTFFHFTVFGSKRICALFRSCLEDDNDRFQWPAKWPNDQFTVNMDIYCKEAAKWGCNKTTQMKFGPFTGPLD